MKRYYDSEIFHQMLDGIDLDNHVIASYYLKDTLDSGDCNPENDILSCPTIWNSGSRSDS